MMSCRYRFWGILSATLLWFSTACSGQTVRIRVVNVATGNPIREQPVAISLLYKGGSTAKPDIRLLTNANGEVQFELPKPAPTHFAVQVSLSDWRWYCDRLIFVTTQDVIEKGFLTSSPDNEAERVFKLEPGEIIFRARPTPWWVRLLYPLAKD